MYFNNSLVLVKYIINMISFSLRNTISSNHLLHCTYLKLQQDLKVVVRLNFITMEIHCIFNLQNVPVKTCFSLVKLL